MITLPESSASSSFDAHPPLLESMQKDHCISTRGLSLWYGTFCALNNVDVDIRHGKVTSLIGPSGCGKTTLLRSFNRIAEIQRQARHSGEVHIFGKNIHDPDVEPSELRRIVGMVFQRPNPLPLSVFENVAFGLRCHNSRRALSSGILQQSVESALRDVHLWEDLKDKLHGPALNLSLEQQQKLCIARLLPLQPRILLMDEPCSALDAASTARIEKLINSLRGRYSVVVVTHNMAQARRISDEAIFMLMGRVIEHRPTGQLFTNPREKETRMYVSGKY